ncbi:hypothetical protein FACS18949_12870 [Clostridia bacterium]|nr:hypothetical protein FACS18949_12870 [Clostridia bacterium]
MTRYIALLRGVNVGGNNKIAMPELRTAFETAGLTNVATYINSGNVIFDSALDEKTAQSLCERAIADKFGLNISVGIITADELRGALANAPEWWNNDDSKHNAIFVIAPATAENVCAEVGEAKPEYEKIAHFGKIIFWTAPLATFSRTRWSKITKHRAEYEAITIHNANTALKLLELSGGSK